jgi:predicted dehydrogenase
MGLVGLRFGAEFAPVYLHHPDVASVAICDTNLELMNKIGDRYGIAKRFATLEAVLASNEVDAVHLLTPVPLHGAQASAILRAGKHCASAVPMVTNLEDIRNIIAAARASSRNYMMMETAVYTREFLYAKEMAARGDLGEIAFLRGAHIQDLEGLPAYWQGMPPMWYATHAVAPLLAITSTRATRVCCMGSGILQESMQRQYGNPYPAETAIFRLESCPAAAEITRTLFRTARSYQESFSVYGSRRGFEWQQLGNEEPVLFEMGAPDQWGFRPISATRVKAPDRPDLLPREIARFTQRVTYDASDAARNFQVGGGHHGSHPHLVHEFVRSIVEGRPPAIDAIKAADWTAAGICAHESALKDGEPVTIPAFG